MNFDLTGKTFTWLKVLSFNGKNKKNEKEWLCQCKCGKFKIATTSGLRRGKIKSCGCYNSARYENLSGKYGKLTVVEFVGKDDKNYKLYKCKCDCGNEHQTRRWYLHTRKYQGDDAKCERVLQIRFRYSAIRRTHRT